MQSLNVCIGAYVVVKITIEMVRVELAGSVGGIGNLIRDLEGTIRI